VDTSQHSFAGNPSDGARACPSDAERRVREDLAAA
jgi:hypothetical protein